MTRRHKADDLVATAHDLALFAGQGLKTLTRFAVLVAVGDAERVNAVTAAIQEHALEIALPLSLADIDQPSSFVVNGGNPNGDERNGANHHQQGTAMPQGRDSSKETLLAITSNCAWRRVLPMPREPANW